MDKLTAVLNALNEFDYEICYDDLDDLCDNFCHEIFYRYGASRWCITSNDWDFVLKFPRYDDTHYNYCAKELENYKSAQAYGISDILLPLEHIYTTSTGMEIYKQAKYSTTMTELTYEQERKLVKRVGALTSCPILDKCLAGCFDQRRISRLWLARVIQLYGKRFVSAFEAWTRECKVNDLHNSNIGFKDGKPIILDYAGYYG